MLTFNMVKNMHTCMKETILLWFQLKKHIFPIYRLGKLLISPPHPLSSISYASDCGRCRNEPLLGGYE